MHDRIETNPAIFNGQPIIKGTRVLVTTILSALSSGDSFEAILQDYPIEREDIQAAIDYASEKTQY